MNPLLFTDPAFLFCFGPIVFTLYHLIPSVFRNAFLLFASLTLYFWGDGNNVMALLAAIAINYCFGRMISRKTQDSSRVLLCVGVTANLLLLSGFKYAAFLVVNLNAVLTLAGVAALPVPHIRLPVGLSFFIFMGISYLVDIYRKEAIAGKSPIDFALYLSLFPHIIAGPIVRYKDLVRQINCRTISASRFTYGIKRFVIGLGKKIMIGNTVAQSADAIFVLQPDQLSAPVAWLGALCYTLQIYFDFSGYSDMAIGLAQMLGFRFPENFNYPYISQSISEFWKRWHISLSTWLRDYLFFSLSQRRRRWTIFKNSLIVFAVCGLWHGASWHFVIWGVYHGIFRALEAAGLSAYLKKLPSVLRHSYLLMVVIIGWVIFRAESLTVAGIYLASMFGMNRSPFVASDIRQYLPLDVLLAMLAGIAGSAPLRLRNRKRLDSAAVEIAALAFLFLVAIATAAAGTYNPFIYFRF